MTPPKPHGYAWISLEGEFTGDDKTIVLDREEPSKELALRHSDTHTVRPVMLLSPEYCEWVAKTKVSLQEISQGLRLLRHEILASAIDVILADLERVERGDI